jgi:hypothetical protein
LRRGVRVPHRPLLKMEQKRTGQSFLSQRNSNATPRSHEIRRSTYDLEITRPIPRANRVLGLKNIKGTFYFSGVLIAGVASWFSPYGSCVGIRGLTSPARQGRAVHVSARMLIAVNEIDHLLQKNSTRKTPRRHGRHSRNTTSEISSRSLLLKIPP